MAKDPGGKGRSNEQHRALGLLSEAQCLAAVGCFAAVLMECGKEFGYCWSGCGRGFEVVLDGVGG